MFIPVAASPKTKILNELSRFAISDKLLKYANYTCSKVTICVSETQNIKNKNRRRQCFEGRAFVSFCSFKTHPPQKHAALFVTTTMNRVINIFQVLVHDLKDKQALPNIHIPQGRIDVEELW